MQLLGKDIFMNTNYPFKFIQTIKKKISSEEFV